MCCRYYMESSEELRPYVEAAKRSPLTDTISSAMCRPMVTDGEVRPADIAPVIARGRSGHNLVVPMKWGFSGKSLVFNARSETASVKPMFREAWAGRRCTVPASCYFEWEHRVSPEGKKVIGGKYRLQAGSGLTWLCGLFRVEEGVPCFVILTREAGESIRFIHDRMPLILPADTAREWLLPSADPDRLLPLAREDLLFRPAG